MGKATINRYEDRAASLNAQVQALHQQAEAETRLLEQRRGAIGVELAAAIAKLNDDAVALTDELGTALALAFQEEIEKPLAAFQEEPSRKLALEACEIYRRYDARAVQELGEPLWQSAIVVAFAIELIASNPSAANVFGNENSAFVQLAAAWAHAIDAGPANAEAALIRIQRGLEQLAASESGPATERNRQRFEVKKQCAAHGHASRMLAAFDAAFAKSELVAAEEREPLGRRVLNAIEELVGS